MEIKQNKQKDGNAGRSVVHCMRNAPCMAWLTNVFGISGLYPMYLVR